MEFRKLGKTGLEVGAISFGGIPLQMCSREEAINLMHRAIELGVVFFDNSRAYTVSEELMGEGFKGNRDKIIIATKSLAREADSIKKEVLISLEKLQTDYIDLYQLHNVPKNELEKVLGPNGALEGLLKLKKAGIIGHIGITSHSLATIESVLEIDEIETIQYPYSAVERQAEEIFKKAVKLGKGIIVMKPLAGGALQDYEKALRFIYENKDVTCSIPGIMSIDQLEKNLKVAERGNLSESERDILFKEAASLGQTFCRRCGYCAPCSQGINIPLCFLLEGYYTRYDLKDWAKERYAALPIKANKCTKCGECEPRCPYDLPIREMMEKVSKIFD